MKRIAIIGGGISGLSALHFLKHRFGAACDVVLYEKEPRLGGTIGTDRKDGFITDWGPNGFLDKVPLTLQLVSEIGADGNLAPANLKAEKRFIYRHNRLHEIVPSPPKFLSSPLLSIKGRARLLAEPFIKQRNNPDDESIFDFAARRIGREAAETLIVPMVSGIYGGDARKLSLKACFPVMVEMEQQYGSLIKAMIAKKKAGKSKGGPAGPQGRLTSFTTGLQQLVEILGEKYRDQIVTGVEITGIEKKDNEFAISFTSRELETYDAVICAAPAFVAARLIEKLDSILSNTLASIPYASISVICLGYKNEHIVHDLRGFGFLIPRTERKRLLGSIWTSSIFENQAPEGMALLRCMIGGATDPEAVRLSDDALLNLTHDEMNDIIGLKARPEFVRLFKWKKGIPQFVMGHPEKVRDINDGQTRHPGMYFTGNAYDGIGLNDCIVRSDKVVTRLAQRFELSP